MTPLNIKVDFSLIWKDSLIKCALEKTCSNIKFVDFTNL